jgi:predicted GIY-YIG superfamily endonuclease
MKTRLERDLQQMPQCVYSIPCECGSNYTGKTGRQLAVWLRDHKHNLKEGLLQKSKLAQYAYEEGQRVDWDEATILEIERNSRYRKYMASANIACLTNPISHSVWTFHLPGSPLTAKGLPT